MALKIVLLFVVIRGHYCHVRHSDGKVSWAKCGGGCYDRRKGNEVIECPSSTDQQGGSLDVIDTDYEDTDYNKDCGEVTESSNEIFQLEPT